MAISTFMGEDGTAYTDDSNKNRDFTATMYDDVDTEEFKIDEEAEKLRLKKQKTKSDVLSLIASAAINAAPMVFDAIKHRHDPTPHKQKKSDLVKFGISMILPSLQVIDTVALDCKIQNKIKEKTPFTLSDIRNVVNVVQSYPSTHRVLSDYFSNVSRQANGQQQIIIDDSSKRDMFLSIANVVSPYIMDKMSDDRYSMLERFSSIIPIKMFGGLVRKLAGTNPKLQQGYNVLTTCLTVADFGNKSLNKAVRSNNGMRSGQNNSLGTFLDVMQDFTGMNRGNISRYNDGFDGWNGVNGSRFNNY